MTAMTMGRWKRGDRVTRDASGDFRPSRGGEVIVGVIRNDPETGSMAEIQVEPTFINLLGGDVVQTSTGFRASTAPDPRLGKKASFADQSKKLAAQERGAPSASTTSRRASSGACRRTTPRTRSSCRCPP